MSGGMFAEFRKVSARDVIVLPDGRSAADGASIVNAMTALGMAETAKLEGHRAILHTAAASNLGQMMQKICSADGIPLINIVRSKEQVDLLDRKSVVWGKSVSVRLDLGGRRSIKKKKQ